MELLAILYLMHPGYHQTSLQQEHLDGTCSIRHPFNQTELFFTKVLFTCVVPGLYIWVWGCSSHIQDFAVLVEFCDISLISVLQLV